MSAAVAVAPKNRRSQVKAKADQVEQEARYFPYDAFKEGYTRAWNVFGCLLDGRLMPGDGQVSLIWNLMRETLHDDNHKGARNPWSHVFRNWAEVAKWCGTSRRPKDEKSEEQTRNICYDAERRSLLLIRFVAKSGIQFALCPDKWSRAPKYDPLPRKPQAVEQAGDTDIGEEQANLKRACGLEQTSRNGEQTANLKRACGFVVRPGTRAAPIPVPETIEAVAVECQGNLPLHCSGHRREGTQLVISIAAESQPVPINKEGNGTKPERDWTWKTDPAYQPYVEGMRTAKAAPGGNSLTDKDFEKGYEFFRQYTLTEKITGVNGLYRRIGAGCEPRFFKSPMNYWSDPDEWTRQYEAPVIRSGNGNGNGNKKATPRKPSLRDVWESL